MLAKHCSIERVRKREAAPEPGREAPSSRDVYLAPSNEKAYHRGLAREMFIHFSLSIGSRAMKGGFAAER